MQNQRILQLASRNKGKIVEMQHLLQDSGWLVKSLDDLNPSPPEWVEDAETFKGNALIKARLVSSFTNDCVLADDSGLVVPVLGGAPGVYSARWAGENASDEQNNQKLLEALSGLTGKNRRAVFVCWFVFIDEKKQEFFFVGQCEGHISFANSGSKGFGYDPIFIPQGYNQSMAELTLAEKNTMSHRHHAMRGFLDLIKKV